MEAVFNPLFDFAVSAFRDFAAFQFLRNALIAGALIGFLCSALSVLVVLKRMAFVGQGISHGAFAGVALALLIFDPAGSAGGMNLGDVAGGAAFLLVTLYSLMLAFLVGWAVRREKLSGDSAIGMFFVVSMALGVLLIATRRAYAADIFGILFGSILAVTHADVWAALGLAVLVALVLALFYKEIAYFAFDEEVAETSGLPAGAIHYGLILLIALAIVVSIRVVGIILVNAFLVIPGLAALTVAKRLPGAIGLSVAVGVGSAALGLALANHLDTPAGATVVMVLFGVYLALSLGKKIRLARGR